MIELRFSIPLNTEQVILEPLGNLLSSTEKCFVDKFFYC